MECEIITIGDEILNGQVVDTNSPFIASEMDAIGIKIRQVTSVPDTEKEILSAIDRAVEQAGLIIITGGLGPTNDDITKKTLAKYFKVPLIRNEQILDFVKKLLSERGVQMSALNEAQADLPENCLPLFNKNGTAPGMLFKTTENKTIVSLPGVPYEMKALITEELIPWLKDNFELPVRLQKTFLITGVPESTMALKLADFETGLPENLSLSYLPSPGILRLRMNAIGENPELVQKQINQQNYKLIGLLGEDLFGFDDDTLEHIVGRMLRENSFTVSTAESCTGGNIARMITSVPGASEYFEGSIVAYSNKIKEGFLGVSPSALKEYGAVSKQVVKQMAEGVKEKMHTDFGIATSGIAGPTGGTEEKPVGTVWIALASPRTTLAIKLQLGENRNRTITRSTFAALNLLRLEIQKIVEKTVEKV